MSKQRWKKYEIGMGYLEKYGIALIFWSENGEKQIFKTGAAFKDLEAETLARPYKIQLKDGSTVEFSEEFMDRFDISTKLDLQRLMRICSILLTDFSGPEIEDNPKNHLERLRKKLKKYVRSEDARIVQALYGYEAMMGYKKQIFLDDYNQAANLLNALYKIW